MNQDIFEQDLINILGGDLEESRMIDDKMEEAYIKIRQMKGSSKKGRKKGKTKILRRVMTGISTVAAAVIVAFTFCAVNPALAEKLPFIGDMFTRVQDVFPFGQVPKEEATPLYSGASLENGGQDTGDDTGNASGAEEESPYRQKVGGLTITLTDIYASNQAIFVGVCVENEQEFPEMATFGENEQQTLQVETAESYSFRDDKKEGCLRNIEGKFEDSHTFIGIMRIDYSEINVDSRRYEEMVKEAEANNEPLPVVDAEVYDKWFDEYEIPETFGMDLQIKTVIGYLADPVEPAERGVEIKSQEELEQMSDEEWEAYMKSLPAEWDEFPNSYENWFEEGSWEYSLTVNKSAANVKTIAIDEVNEEGIGMESIELSPVEMTLNPIEPAGRMTFAVALDANGEKIDFGSSNAYELAISGHDISTVYIYIFDYDEYMDDIKGYFFGKDTGGRNVQEILEERALFKTTVNTEQ